jgi:hypothetical protein
MMALVNDTTGTASTLKANLATYNPLVSIFHEFAQADLRVVDATTSLSIDALLHTFREVLREWWRIGVDTWHCVW